MGISKIKHTQTAEFLSHFHREKSPFFYPQTVAVKTKPIVVKIISNLKKIISNVI